MAINTDPTNGETPLAQSYYDQLHATPTTGGSDAAAQQWAFLDFQKQFGRNPTQSELNQLAPTYSQNDKNLLNLGAGKAAVSGYFNSIANTPTNIQDQQTQAGLKKYQTGQAGFDATTNAAFQQATGRTATQDELSHFGGLLASGAIDPYGLSQLVGQTAEAQNKATAGYQDTLSKNLQSTQGDYFQKYINPSIMSQTAAAGRDPNSSGVQQAEVQAGKQQNYDLQNYLANFGASQYGQSAQNQQGVYGQYLNQQYGLQNAGISQQLGQQNYMQQQNTNLANYQMQQNAYNQYLNRYGRTNNGIGGAFMGALSGAASGYKATGSPWGAAGGAVLGGAGGYAQGGGNF